MLAIMDPVDLNDRLAAQQAALGASESRLAQAQARERYARTQSERYRKLLAAQGTSQEIFLTKQQEWTSAKAEEQAAHNEMRLSRSNITALQTQIEHLMLRAPVGALAYVDVLDFEQNAQMVRAALVEQQGQRLANTAKLFVAMGVAPQFDS